MDANIKELNEQELDQVSGGFLLGCGGGLLGGIIKTKVSLLSGFLSIFGGGKTSGGCNTGCNTGCAPTPPRC